MTDREKIQILRSCTLQVGHTDGQPFEKGCVTVCSGRSYDLFAIGEIQEIMNHFNSMAAFGSIPSPTDRFVYRMFQDNGIITAFAYLGDCMNAEDREEI